MKLQIGEYYEPESHEDSINVIEEIYYINKNILSKASYERRMDVDRYQKYPLLTLTSSGIICNVFFYDYIGVKLNRLEFLNKLTKSQNGIKFSKFQYRFK